MTLLKERDFVKVYNMTHSIMRTCSLVRPGILIHLKGQDGTKLSNEEVIISLFKRYTDIERFTFGWGNNNSCFEEEYYYYDQNILDNETRTETNCSIYNNNINNNLVECWLTNTDSICKIANFKPKLRK